MKVESVFFLNNGNIAVFGTDGKQMPEFQQYYKLQGRELMTRIFEDKPKIYVSWMQPVTSKKIIELDKDLHGKEETKDSEKN